MSQSPVIEPPPDSQEVLTAWAADIDTIIPDPNNARKHNHKNIQAIKGSLQRFGQRKPIVIGTNNVIQAGGGTHIAAKELGWETILVIRSPLVGQEAAAYSLADNRAGELAEWDYENLSVILKSYSESNPEATMELQSLGWDASDLEPLLGADWKPATIDDLGGDERKPLDHKNLILTLDEWSSVKRAIERRKAGDADLTDGRCVELLCLDYLFAKESDAESSVSISC